MFICVGCAFPSYPSQIFSSKCIICASVCMCGMLKHTCRLLGEFYQLNQFGSHTHLPTYNYWIWAHKSAFSLSNTHCNDLNVWVSFHSVHITLNSTLRITINIVIHLIYTDPAMLLDLCDHMSRNWFEIQISKQIKWVQIDFID